MRKPGMPLSRCVTEQLIVLQEGSVAPVVRDEPREPEAEIGVLVARVGPVAWGERDVRVLPRAPLARRALTNGGVGIGQQRRVCVNER